jgi:hypothetical protein
MHRSFALIPPPQLCPDSPPPYGSLVQGKVGLDAAAALALEGGDVVGLCRVLLLLIPSWSQAGGADGRRGGQGKREWQVRTALR